MQTLESLKIVIRFVIRYIPIALGFVFGILTNLQYEKIIDGILGAFTVFFIYLLFLPEKITLLKDQLCTMRVKKILSIL